MVNASETAGAVCREQKDEKGLDAVYGSALLYMHS
jgi:hypothetical protein